MPLPSPCSTHPPSPPPAPAPPFLFSFSLCPSSCVLASPAGMGYTPSPSPLLSLSLPVLANTSYACPTRPSGCVHCLVSVLTSTGLLTGALPLRGMKRFRCSLQGPPPRGFRFLGRGAAPPSLFLTYLLPPYPTIYKKVPTCPPRCATQLDTPIVDTAVGF
jgi:hypothetical protein